jgi:hypothetical protein
VHVVFRVSPEDHAGYLPQNHAARDARPDFESAQVPAPRCFVKAAGTG